MILHCVRHGESSYNAQRRIQGQSDPPLSSLGRLQAQALAESMTEVPIDAIYSSPLARARQTAEPTSRALGIEIEFDDRLMEIHAGVFQDMLWTEIETEHAEHARRWIAQEPDFVIPGGESRAQLAERGRAVLESIRQSGFQHVAVFSHGGLLAAALKSLLEIPAHLNPFSLMNASISRVRWANRFELHSLNQIEHLRRDHLESQPWSHYE